VQGTRLASTEQFQAQMLMWRLTLTVWVAESASTPLGGVIRKVITEGG
jgi:hypothetical protein